MLGGPFSGWLLESSFTLGFKNWQWMFIVQGILTVLVGIVAYFVLVSRPDDAKWLNPEEKNLLNQALILDREISAETELTGNDNVFRDWRVWRFVFIYFSIQMSVYGILFYLPTKLALLLQTNVGLEVGYYSAIPWVCTLILLPIITRYADRKANWTKMAICMLSCAVFGIVSSTLVTHLFGFLIFVSIAIVGFIVVQPIFWNIPTQYLSGRAIAIGTALIGSLGNLGGFVAPNLKNYLDSYWHNDIAGLLALAAVGCVGVILLCALLFDQHKETQHPLPHVNDPAQ